MVLSVLDTFNSSLPVLGTLFSGFGPKQRNGLELYPLTYEKRKEVTRTLIKVLQAMRINVLIEEREIYGVSYRPIE